MTRDQPQYTPSPVSGLTRNNGIFVLIVGAILMAPVLYIVHQYDGVYAVFNAVLGTVGMAVLLVALYWLLKPISQVLAKVITILLFFVFLFTRIILSFVYDFSGRGFTSEFFAHFSWDSFVIGFDEYGVMLVIATLAMLACGWLLAKLLTARQQQQHLLLVGLMTLGAVLVWANGPHIPEFRLYTAYKNYHKVVIDIQDIAVTRTETTQLLEPIRNTTALPPLKSEITAQVTSQPKNLIIIYLESFSDVLTDNPRYPGLTPNLDRLKHDHFSFAEYFSSGYVTIEGIANSQCGTLLNMDSGNNSLTSAAGRLSELPCMGDILKAAGYQQVFMGGADLEFAGKGAFFTEHGYDEVWGKYKWEANGYESANTWGLSDADLFDQAVAKAVELSQSPQPFNLTLLTLATHIPGYSYRGCEDYDSTISDHPFINGIHCTDQLVGDFIERLDQQGVLANTVVQIQGDHGIFPTHEMRELFGQRSNAHMIYNTTITPNDWPIELAANRPSATMNMAANLLDILQVQHNVRFIMSAADRPDLATNPYIMTRYTDFYDGQMLFNAWAENADCSATINTGLKLPLDYCGKQAAIQAIYRLGATYSDRFVDQEVCSLGAEITIDETTKKAHVRWGNLTLSDQFIASGRTFTEPKAGFYMIELNHRDQVINQLFFDHHKSREMKYLSDLLNKAEHRYVLFSNLPSKTISKLSLDGLPEGFAEHKLLYAQNTEQQINSLFEVERMTGSIGFLPASCQGQTQVSHYTPNPALGLAKFCQVKSWGPKQMVLGTSFNQQPNGDSAFWFKTDCAPAGTVVRFDATNLKTVERLPTITARIDTELLIQQAGSHRLMLTHPETDTEYDVGVFEVLPNDDYQPQWPKPQGTPAKAISPPLLIAHAGGGINGQTYVNSLEALNHNYALGHRLFEIDFSWTADDALVAIHDWQQTYQRYFDGDPDNPPTRAQFMSLPMKFEQTQMDLASLDQWLLAHPDAFIVTDIKGHNLAGLKQMVRQMTSAPQQIIPQMYHPHNHSLIQSLGYQHIIFTLYATPLPYYEIIDFVSQQDLFAVTVHPGKQNFQAILTGVNEAGTFVYVHTYNTIEELELYLKVGVKGIYTDHLYVNEQGEVATQ